MICFEDCEGLFFFFFFFFNPLDVFAEIEMGVGIPDVRVLCEHSAAWMAVDSLATVFVSITVFLSLVKWLLEVGYQSS